MPENWQGKLEKIDNYRWRLPKTYKPGMRVEGIVYSDEKLLKDIFHDKALEQVANVAFLPGIVNASLAMPDIHWGYGFPIGGVAATDIGAGGVVSPGGVGFDINCLTGESKILTDKGFTVKIKDLEADWKKTKLITMNFSKKIKEETDLFRFIKVRPKEKILQITTFGGQKIKATRDHPFWTEDGMVALKRLKQGDKVAVYPFAGVDFENPSDEVIIDEKDVLNLLSRLKKDLGGNAKAQIINQLKKRGLLPLRYNSSALPYLIKVAGYSIGDGNVHFVKLRGKGISWFWGKSDDLELIRRDIEKIGFKCSKIYSRQRKHKIQTWYDLVEFENLENSCKVCSSAFAIMLVLLGVPFGNKTDTPYLMPKWLFRAPLWQKRLFLAAYFGAEMSAPKSFLEHGYNLYCPVVSMNKRESLVDNGVAFLEGVSKLLSEFGISALKISRNAEYISKKGTLHYRLRLILSNKSEDLINLYSRVGFEYNRQRSFLANTTVQFLRHKDEILRTRQEAESSAIGLHAQGYSAEKIYKMLGSKFVNMRFIERSVYGERKTDPRISSAALNFADFIDEHTQGLGYSGMIWDKIVSIAESPFEEYVYDFTVNHQDHNFIANNFVVSNCGVRLLKTNLQYNDVKDKIKDLTCVLFSNVPSGVGSKGDIRVSVKEEREILLKGAGWAVAKGYGIKEDLECTEESGALSGADPEAVSERAYERGKAQSGTLGSGNHFLEIQVVDQLYDRQLSDAFGLDLGQVMVMIHSGSRGFGYQICDDYARSMVRCLQNYNINVPDRQLACAPVNSPEAKAYLGAMRCAANYAWANRQCLMHLARRCFEKFFNASWQGLGMHLIYDVAHNIAKIEKYNIDGEEKLLCVHRKGATRAFGPGNPALPPKYKNTGQPVIIPGDMGRNSYLLVGTKKAEEETFGSTCHGAGRLKSRTAATRSVNFSALMKQLEAKGITVMASGRGTIVEEAPEAYKDVNEVVDVVHSAGISKRVARMRPLGVIKG
ncbi:MAG: RNA-splicing ligase RtcB [Candidatus Omnitrophica bacterium CG11_big_fil_rev_8_21_14_0_20_42_13]|uniref:tRNA-splicing ligase RtcB n=1 Tax=Candidatus Ghiorseimicrobium undicola TaxID=1974746 RepID=A0A2H0LZI3_9BACT|nr:MAG: RNA-splicing ligase RtcB [Candidatus Omnitrophica bacterium CG11_big_fil_rev_8_21_14_0_20_42_13]